MRLNVRAFALTCAIVWGLGLFAVTWWVIILEGASGNTTWLTVIYRGYSLSLAGSFIGLAWAFVDGLVGGLVFAWLYNFMARRFERGSRSSEVGA
jgi:hypothetical protein